jgi:hypothetical protein
MSELILYKSEDGQTQMQLREEEGTIWLSQAEIAELFQTTKQNVSLHAKNILEEGELRADSVVKESLTTAADGKNYRTKLHNLDLILAIGYRVRSPRGSQFRQWATFQVGLLIRTRRCVYSYCWFCAICNHRWTRRNADDI